MAYNPYDFYESSVIGKLGRQKEEALRKAYSQLAMRGAGTNTASLERVLKGVETPYAEKIGDVQAKMGLTQAGQEWQAKQQELQREWQRRMAEEQRQWQEKYRQGAWSREDILREQARQEAKKKALWNLLGQGLSIGGAVAGQFLGIPAPLTYGLLSAGSNALIGGMPDENYPAGYTDLPPSWIG